MREPFRRRYAGGASEAVAGSPPGRLAEWSTHLSTDEPHRAKPWLAIPAEDYEGYRGSPQVGQLAHLSAVFGEMLDRYGPRSVAVVGRATGNGFDRIGPRGAPYGGLRSER